jgi:L-alanine-DL-glutamate epimerase and related enzymes of enolase superfamily
MGTIKEVRVDIPNHNHLTQVIVTVETLEGNIGRGEAWWGIPNPSYPGSTSFPIASVIENLITPHLIGKDSRTIEKHWFDIWDYGYRYADQGIFTMGLSGVDLALWDLLGKELNVPVAQVLGGVMHDGLPAYASLPPLRDPDLVVSEVRRAIESGFNAVKLHEIDPMYVHLLHNNFGDSLGIMVDVNGHFSLIEAIAFGKEISNRNIIWYEEPVRPMRDHKSIKKVSDQTGLPIAAGENEYTLNDFKNILESDSLDLFYSQRSQKIGGVNSSKKDYRPNRTL